MSLRAEKVASLIREEIGGLVTREFNDPALGFITVTDVRVTDDLRIARVAFSVYGNDDMKTRAMKALEDQKPHIRSFVGSHLRLRFTPFLEFHLDNTAEKAERINRILKQLDEEKNGEGKVGPQS